MHASLRAGDRMFRSTNNPIVKEMRILFIETYMPLLINNKSRSRILSFECR